MNIDKRIARLEKQLAEAKAEKERLKDPIIATIVITGGGYNTRVTLKDVSYSVANDRAVEKVGNVFEIKGSGPTLNLWGDVIVMEELR